MSDLIDRQAAIDALRKLSREDGYIDMPHEFVTDAVRALPSAQSEPKWIPVNKKAHPDLPIRVQVQLRNGWIITAYWYEGNWFSVPCWGRIGDHIDDDEYYKIEAWRELPESYTERNK